MALFGFVHGQGTWSRKTNYSISWLDSAQKLMLFWLYFIWPANTLPVQDDAVDVVFIIDETSSMSAEHKKVKDRVRQLFKQLNDTTAGNVSIHQSHISP